MVVLVVEERMGVAVVVVDDVDVDECTINS